MYYSILAVTPTSEDWIPGYLEVAGQLVAKHGGKYLARTASHSQLEGDKQDAALRIVLQWPSKEAAEAFMADPEYAPQLEARTAGSTSSHFLIEGNSTPDKS